MPTDGEEARTLRTLQAAAVTYYRIAFGPRAGQNVLTLRGAMPRETWARQPLCADIDWFSLHAAVRVEALDRKRLEQLCRYIARPALSDERIQLNATGQVELKLKTPWHDGTTHLVMNPLEFMQRCCGRPNTDPHGWSKFGRPQHQRRCRCRLGTTDRRLASSQKQKSRCGVMPSAA
ncbi:MAG: transposase [Rubrivivax sp.]